MSERQKWDYQTIVLPEGPLIQTQIALCEQGQAGWELVQIESGSFDWEGKRTVHFIAIFKRPLKEPSQ